MNQEITFTLDTQIFCIWIDFAHAERLYDPIFRYRLNCSDRTTMALRANYWLFREFPQVTDIERADFRMKWSGFYEANQEQIESLARELGIRKIKAMNDLIADCKTQLKAGFEESKRK